MTEFAKKWEPIAGIDITFGSLSHTFSERSLSVTLRGAKSLLLNFSGVVAFRFELECPGLDPLPKPLPMLRPGAAFPLLVIEHSDWLGQYAPIYRAGQHFSLITSDHLFQVIANPEVVAQWE